MNGGDLAGRLHDLTTKMTTVRRDARLREGDELVNLVRDVEQCCGAVTELSGDANAKLRSQLVGLLDELDRLDLCLTRDRADLADRLKGLARFGGARSAYTPRRR